MSRKQQQPTFGPAPRIAMWVGILLILLGLVSRYLLGIHGVSSLSPSLFGFPLAMLGFVALDPQYARGALRWTAVLALFGLLVTLHVLPRWPELWLGQQPPGSTAATLASSTMLLLCGILLLVCGLAFVSDWYQRRRR
jgi:hypothetical protein